MKIARDRARDNDIYDGGRSEESENEADLFNDLKSESDSGDIDLDSHVVVDERELDDYLDEAKEMDELENEREDSDWESLESGPDDDDSDGDTDSRNQVRVDADIAVQDEPKFIVFLSCLVTLFSMFCFNCKCERPDVELKKNGTMVTVVQQCKSCKQAGKIPFKWHSQPFVLGRHPAGNLVLSMAILAAGASVTKVLLVFYHMRLSVYTAHTFFTHQRKYIFSYCYGNLGINTQQFD